MDGKLSQVTDFKNVALGGINAINLPLPDWSPNGRYMVFDLAEANHPAYDRWVRLYIWDALEKVAYKPCLPDEKNILEVYRGLWSPDGDYFVMYLPYKDDGTPTPSSEEFRSYATHSRIVILDMASKTIYELPDKNNRGGYTTYYGDKIVWVRGWVNWKIP